MSLSKQQMIGAVGAGVFVLAAGGLGWMLFSAWSERGEAEERLADETAAYRRYHEAPVFPSKRSIDAVKTNAALYAAWHEGAVKFAARADRVTPLETPPIFKQRLQTQVRRMAALPGGANGKISSAEFLYGFDQYLGEGGVLPQIADVPRLACQLDTISAVVDVFSDAGVLEVKSVQRIEQAKDDAENNDEDRPRKKKANKKKKNADDENAPQVTCLEYKFEIITRPAALVSVLNALTATERFCVVKDLSFKETSDMIVDKITALENAKNQKGRSSSSSSRRRRGSAAAVLAEAAEVKPTESLSKQDRVVVDPEMDAPLSVTFTLAVHDFGRATVPVAVTETAEAPVEVAEKSVEAKADNSVAPVTEKPVVDKPVAKVEEADIKKEGK